MNVEIGAEAALFPEKEFIKGIFVAVQVILLLFLPHNMKFLSLSPTLDSFSEQFNKLPVKYL
jgi:hypothetical protein